MKMKRGLPFFFFAMLLSFCAASEEPARSKSVTKSVSPDKQWEFHCDEDLWSSIVNATTHQIVLDLTNAVDAPYCDSAEAIWSPDSKRFAFNHSPSHMPHTVFVTTSIFELHGDKWEEMQALVHQESSESQLVQITKQRPVKSKDLHHDVLRTRSWADNDTLVVYAYSLWNGKSKNSSDRRAAFAVTVKLGAKGEWKVVKKERLPDNQIEDF